MHESFGDIPSKKSGPKRREAERRTAVAASGRSSDLFLETVEKGIGSGGHGTIDRVAVTATGADGRGRDAGNFIVKEYHSQVSGRRYAEEAVKKHEFLRANGFGTWRTFRRIEGGGAVLMTDGGLDGSVVVARNMSKAKNPFAEHSLEVLENFSEAVTKGALDALHADRIGLLVPEDAWLISLKRDEERDPSGKTAFVGGIFIGDYDLLYGHEAPSGFVPDNVAGYRCAVVAVLHAVLSPDAAETFVRECDRVIGSVRESDDTVSPQYRQTS